MIAKKFEDQVEKTPHNIALKTGEKTFTYEELNRYANCIARLILKTLKPSEEAQRVSLLLDHGPDMIAAVLGVLKTGNAYVPLAVDYPDKRLSYMIANSQSSLILTRAKYEERARLLAPSDDMQCLSVDRALEQTPAAAENPGVEIPGGRLAYIMYTSGSTGRPKGVMQNHENVLYYTRNWTRLFSITHRDRMTLFSSFCHDGSVQDMFGALLNGAALYPVDASGRQGGFELCEFLVQEEITLWHSVHSLFAYFAGSLSGKEEFPALRWILLGGEAMRTHEIDLFKKFFPHSVLANIYGQTESSVNSAWIIHPADPIKHLLIGAPLDRTRIFILDEKGGEVDHYGVGEIMVACPHVSPGYWLDEEATARVFSKDEELGAIYFTGDLGRLLPGGQIEFMGRRDAQVKLRGFRIELGEIESRLLKHPRVQETAAAAKEIVSSGAGDGSGDKYLCAYIVARDSRGKVDQEEHDAERESDSPGQASPIDIQELKAFLALELPDYMIPTYFVFLERLPLTQSGKIDRRALPLPKIGTRQEYTAPRTPVEEKLAVIWSAVLGVEKEKIGIDADFFELGGHSLRGIAMLSRVHREFNVQVPVVKIFQLSTIRSLAAYIGESAQDIYMPILSAAKKKYYAVSSIQERLFILNEIEGIGTAYNLRSVLYLEGKLDIKRLEQAFKKLIARHESLRTSFELRDEKPVQIIHDTVDFGIEYYDAAQSEAQIIEGFVRPFDLSRAPLMRAGLIKTAADKYILLRDTHHIVSDGTSQVMLLRELITLYEGKELPPLHIQYKDYVEWRAAPQQQALLKKQEEYWLKLFSSGIPQLENFTDFPRPRVQEFTGDLITMEFDEDLTQRLNRMTRTAGATLYMVLLAVYNILLFKYTGCRDIVVGTPIAGREQPEVEDVVGLFINALVMRNYPTAGKTFAQFLEEVKMNTTAAFENQAYPFGDLMEKLHVKNDISRNPIYDVELIVQNMDISLPSSQEIRIEAYPFEVKVAQVDAALYVMEFGGKIFFRCIYSTGLFKRVTMERFMAHFKDIVSQVVEKRDICLQDIVLSHNLENVKAGVYAEMAADLIF